MKITLLGTGSPIPDPRRAGPSTLVQTTSATLLADAGRGVLMRLMGAGVVPPMLSGVLVTHLHSDHICDLNDVVTTHWVMSPVRQVLRIWGPPGIRETIDGMLAMLAPDMRYRIAHHADLNDPPLLDVVEVAPGDRFEVGGAIVVVGATDHKPVEPTVAYRIEDAGQSVVLGGDGVPCTGLDELCRGADAYVQTVIRDDLVKMVPSARLQDILDYHSSVEQAAQTAARAGVAHLVLTHYVPSIQPGQEDGWKALATPHFSGTITLGDDLTALEF